MIGAPPSPHGRPVARLIARTRLSQFVAGAVAWDESPPQSAGAAMIATRAAAVHAIVGRIVGPP